MSPNELNSYRAVTARNGGPSPNGYLLGRICSRCHQRRLQTPGCKLKIAKSRFEKTVFVCTSCVEEQKRAAD